MKRKPVISTKELSNLVANKISGASPAEIAAVLMVVTSQIDKKTKEGYAVYLEGLGYIHSRYMIRVIPATGEKRRMRTFIITRNPPLEREEKK